MRSPRSASSTIRSLQPPRRDDDRFDIAHGRCIDQRRSTRQLRQFAHEAAGAMRHDRLIAHVLFMRRDQHFAAQNDL
jgi:hypothetical protein